MRQLRTWLIKQLEKLLLIPVYFRALAKEWINILFGETLVGIGFLIWWALGAPTNHALIVVFVVAMFVAGYYAWRAEHVRLERKLNVLGLSTQEWRIELGLAQGGRRMRSYYLGIANKSEGETIEAVGVQLRTIEPRVENLDWLPVPLHVKHDNPIRPQHYTKNFDLNPGDLKNIDIVSSVVGDSTFNIVHVVPGVNSSVPLSSEGHRMEVMITAKDMPALYVRLKAWKDETGILKCEVQSG